MYKISQVPRPNLFPKASGLGNRLSHYVRNMERKIFDHKNNSDMNGYSISTYIAIRDHYVISYLSAFQKHSWSQTPMVREGFQKNGNFS